MASYYTGKVYEHPRHNASFSMSRSMRSITEHELGERTNRSVVELDGKLRNIQRRRVPLACARCRKRKIKCSGDAGDGQSCTNCRSAGNTDCQFLRMNSWPSWPYPSLGAGTTRSPRPARMYHQASGKPTFSGMGSSQAASAELQRGSDFDIGSADVHGYPRPAVVGVDSVPYEGEQPTTYSKPSAYILPSAPPGAMVEFAGSPWSPKIWDSVLAVSRPPAAGIYPEPESTQSLYQSHLAYMLTGHALGSHEIPPSTNAAMSVIPSSDADRTLPVPTCQSYQLPSSQPSLNIIPSEGGSNMALKDNYWDARCGTTSSQRTTATATVPSNGSFSSGSPSPMTMKPDTNPSEMLFNYLPLPATTDDMTPALSSSAGSAPSTTSADTPYAGLESLGTSSDHKTMPSDNRASQGYSGEHGGMEQRPLALTDGSTPDLYGYSGGGKERRTTDDNNDNRCSPASLMNGMPYQRVRHGDASNLAFSFNMFPHTMSEYHRSVMKNVQRPPVSPLGNENGY